MVLKPVYIALGLAVCSVSVLLVVLLMKENVPEYVDPVQLDEETTQPPTTTAAPRGYDIQTIGGAAVLYPRVPLMDLNYRPRRYEINPGAYFPGLRGVKLDEAIHVVANTFPMLSVRAIPDGFPLDLEVRRDRVTVIIDPATNYVIDARIG